MSKSQTGKGGRLIKNIALIFTGSFVTKILSFFMVPLYTSWLSTSDYGVADLISTTVLLALPIFSMLMEESVLRFALDNSTDKKQVLSVGLTLSTFGFLIALAVSPILLLFDSLRPYYWFVLLYYISLWLYNIFSFFVRGLDKVAICTVGSIIHCIAFLSINIVGLVVLKWGVYAYLLAIDVSNLIAAAFLFFYCRLYQNIINIKKIDRHLAKEMLQYSLPMIPDYISWWINNGLDRYMLAGFCNNGVVGLYSVAHKIPSILSTLSGIFSSAWRISSVDEFGTEKSVKFYSQIYRLYSGFLIISASAIILFVKPIASILFAKEFFNAWKITPILILAHVFSALAIFVGSIFTASKKTKKLFIAPLAGAVANIIFNIIFIPEFEAIGAAWATVIGYMVIWVVQMINTAKILKIDLNFKVLIPSLLLITAEIFSVSMDSLFGVLSSVICMLIVFAINFKVLLYFIKMAFQKLTNIKSNGSN